MFLYGKNSVVERIKANPSSIQRIFIQDNFDDTNFFQLIKSLNIPVKKISSKNLFKIKAADNLQGIVAEIYPFKYAPFEEITASKEPRKTVIFLDRIYDPQNMGSIIRTAACLGNFAVVITEHKACKVTDTVLHVACGGENYVPVSLVSNLSYALAKAKSNGYWIAGAVVNGGQNIAEAKFPFPLGLVLGSEGTGIRYGIDKHLDLRMFIAMEGAPLSLNVTVACGIFCYEIWKQRRNH